MALELQFGTTAGNDFINKGTGVPQWNNDLNNSWDFPNDTYNYAYSLDGDNVYIQYGRQSDYWATKRYYRYDVRVAKQTTNPDNSITADIEVDPQFWKTALATSGPGVRVRYSISVNGQGVWHYEGNTQDIFERGKAPTVKFTETIPPQGESWASALRIQVYYPDHEYPDNDAYVGFKLVNTNPPTVSPWAVYDCETKTWKTTNRKAGGAWRRDCNDNTWKPVKTSDGGTSPVKQGTARYDCTTDKWVNQHKIGKE